MSLKALILEKPHRELRLIFILLVQINNDWASLLESLALKVYLRWPLALDKSPMQVKELRIDSLINAGSIS